MLTVAYCRVSTEEQAAEGFSIDGQQTKLTAYADLHDLGNVTVVSDPGASGKNLKRPGLQQLVAMVEAGHVAHVLVWRLDRLSRDLGDLIVLAKLFEDHGVGIHSVTESLDLTSPTGRMFFHILGSFARFYREQLAENVKMGMAQARAEGRWTSRPPLGYDLVDGMLVPNAHAATVRRVFELRARGASQTEIREATGLNHSTVVEMLRRRTYLGEIPHKGTWSPGKHEPIISKELWNGAHRGRRSGVKRGRDLMSGRVRCGLCGRAMSIESNGHKQQHYRCKHRGRGCTQPARSNKGPLTAAVLALGLLRDPELQDAIRRHLGERRRRTPSGCRRSSGTAEALAARRDEQHKLLQLHYAGTIDADLFSREQARLRREIENLTFETDEIAVEAVHQIDLAARFEEVLQVLEERNIADLWPYATEQEQRTLLDELLDHVEVHPDRLTVAIHGAPPLNVAFSEVGLKDSELSRVGGGAHLPKRG